MSKKIEAPKALKEILAFTVVAPDGKPRLWLTGPRQKDCWRAAMEWSGDSKDELKRNGYSVVRCWITLRGRKHVEASKS